MWFQNDPEVIFNTLRLSRQPWVTYLASSEILAHVPYYVPLILLSMTTSMRFFDQCPANEDLLAILLQTPSFSYTKSVGLRHFILFEALRC